MSTYEDVFVSIKIYFLLNGCLAFLTLRLSQVASTPIISVLRSKYFLLTMGLIKFVVVVVVVVVDYILVVCLFFTNLVFTSHHSYCCYNISITNFILSL